MVCNLLVYEAVLSGRWAPVFQIRNAVPVLRSYEEATGGSSEMVVLTAILGGVVMRKTTF